jgi:Vitamin B6 photo-protection and homoeostasis
MLYCSRAIHSSLFRSRHCSCPLKRDQQTPFCFPTLLYRHGIALVRSSSSKIGPRPNSFIVIQYPSIDRVSPPLADTLVSFPTKDSLQSSSSHISGNNDPKSIQSLYGARSIVFTSEKCPELSSAHTQFWKRHEPRMQRSNIYVPWKENDSMPMPLRWISQQIYHKLLIHFVPAQYPNSVQQPGYTYYSVYGFVASVAGSASMVLSTQTLLCTMMSCTAGGEQSSLTATTSSTAAGALNWVLKDGIGQLGGIMVMSYMGQLRALDSNPKRYRMFAAILLDAAAIVELCTPLGVLMISSSAVVPMACLATLFKNVGFIMASASRATIHQSLCNTNFSHETASSSAPVTIPNNLADVTAKFGSQSTAAGLLGTLLGITISTWLPIFGNHPDHGFFNYYSATVILGLVCVHQTCNFMALRSVALFHLNRQRLCILIKHYIQNLRTDDYDSSGNTVTQTVLTPMQVAEREIFLPLFFDISTSSRNESNMDWLNIGCSLECICPNGSEQLLELVHACDNEQYILNVNGDTRNGRIQLVFFEQAHGNDLIRGMFHAFALRDALVNRRAPVASQGVDKGSLDEKETNALHMIYCSHQWFQSRFDCFIDQLHAAGWNTKTIFVEEGSKSYRLAVRFGQAS